MKALSIRQPWAWLILNAGKDIENRDWPTKVRGRVLVHVGKTVDPVDACDAIWTADDAGFDTSLMPSPADLPRGGIVGTVEIVDCVTDSDSHWFYGRYGFVLRDPRPMEFIPMRGRLGFFEVPEISL